MMDVTSTWLHPGGGGTAERCTNMSNDAFGCEWPVSGTEQCRPSTAVDVEPQLGSPYKIGVPSQTCWDLGMEPIPCDFCPHSPEFMKNPGSIIVQDILAATGACAVKAVSANLASAGYYYYWH